MNLSSNSRAGLLLVATLGAVWAAACSDDDGPNGINELGGSTYGGGVSPSSTAGGSSNVGGASGVQGGTVGNGGSSVVNSAGSGATPTSGGTTMAGGSSSVGGASSAGAPTAGAGGGTAACGTTKGSFDPFRLTVAANSTFPLGGFVKSGNNTAQVVDVVTSPAFCADGCLRMSGAYSTSDAAYSGTVAIQKELSGANANLLGAKVVVKMAIEGLKASIPMWLTLTALGSNDSWGSSTGKGNAELASFNGQLAEFVWNVADLKDYNQKQFCAAAVKNVGIMLQTSAKPTEAGTVTLYIKSIDILPAGYVPQGTGGGSGVAGSAGASSTLTAGNAGTAGSNQ